jgi:ATP-dependent Clp protease ATP-binding subunit ClpA
VFHKFAREAVFKILDIHLKSLAERLRKQGLLLEVSDAVRSWLSENGFDPLYGARPLRRLLEQEVENRIAQEIIRVGRDNDGKNVNGRLLRVELEQGARQQLVVNILS